MALDSALKRRAVAGVARPYMRAQLPAASPTEPWRVSVGNAYPVAGFNAPSDNITYTRNDEMRIALQNAGFTGHLQDMLLAWLANEGYTVGSLEDRWLNFLAAAGFTTGDINDRKLAYYLSLGAPVGSSLTDAEFWVWDNNPPT